MQKNNKLFISLSAVLIGVLCLAQQQGHMTQYFFAPGAVQGTYGHKVQLAGTMSGVSGATTCDDGSKNITTSGCTTASGGGVNAQTANYTAATADAGKLITMNGSSLTLTLPNPPLSANWWVSIENLAATNLTISRNSLTINGGTSNITLIQYAIVSCWTDNSNYFCSTPLVAGSNITFTAGSNGLTIASSAGSIGGVNAQTVNYTLVGADSGKLVTMNGSSLTATLPSSPPSAVWYVAIENLAVSALTVARNGLTINGGTADVTLQQYQITLCWTDNANYFCMVPLVAGSNITLTPGSGGITIASTAGSIGGVNAQTAAYTLQASDNGKLVTMNGSSLTAKLPASPPSATWFAAIQNLAATALTVDRNGLTINGGTSNITLQQYQSIFCWTDNANYFCSVPLVAGTNITLTQASNGQTVASTSGGAFTLLAEATASSSASLGFTTRNATGQSGNIFQSDYDDYEIRFLNVLPATNNVDLELQVHTGGSYDSTAGHYVNDLGYHYSGGASQASNGTAYMRPGGSLSNNSNYGFTGNFQLTNPLSTALFKFMQGDGMGFDANVSAILGGHVISIYNQTSAIDGFQILFSSGNISSGTVRVYGIAK